MLSEELIMRRRASASLTSAINKHLIFWVHVYRKGVFVCMPRGKEKARGFQLFEYTF